MSGVLYWHWHPVLVLRVCTQGRLLRLLPLRRWHRYSVSPGVPLVGSSRTQRTARTGFTFRPCSPRPCSPLGPLSLFPPYDDRLTYRSHSHNRESSCRPSASSERRSVGSSGISGRSSSGCSRERSFASSTRPRRSRSPAQVRSSQPFGWRGSCDDGVCPPTRKRGWTRLTTIGPRL